MMSQSVSELVSAWMVSCARNQPCLLAACFALNGQNLTFEVKVVDGAIEPAHAGPLLEQASVGTRGDAGMQERGAEEPVLS